MAKCKAALLYLPNEVLPESVLMEAMHMNEPEYCIIIYFKILPFSPYLVKYLKANRLAVSSQGFVVPGVSQ